MDNSTVPLSRAIANHPSVVSEVEGLTREGEEDMHFIGEGVHARERRRWTLTLRFVVGRGVVGLEVVEGEDFIFWVFRRGGGGSVSLIIHF